MSWSRVQAAAPSLCSSHPSKTKAHQPSGYLQKLQDRQLDDTVLWQFSLSADQNNCVHFPCQEIKATLQWRTSRPWNIFSWTVNLPSRMCNAAVYLNGFWSPSEMFFGEERKYCWLNIFGVGSLSAKRSRWIQNAKYEARWNDFLDNSVHTFCDENRLWDRLVCGSQSKWFIIFHCETVAHLTLLFYMSVINPRCAKQWSRWIWTGKHKAIRKHTRKPFFILSCTLTNLGQVSCYSAKCLTQNVINLWNCNHWTNHFCHNFLCQCFSV